MTEVTYDQVIEFLEKTKFKCSTQAQYITPTINILKKKRDKQ